MLYNLMVW